MDLLHGVFPLEGVVQHYSWGGMDFIPGLLQKTNRENQPYAEYWLGAHPNHPSIVDGNPLTQLLQSDPGKLLGLSVAQKFGALPYLLKVLDVRQMLSIQVHPDKTSAALSFEEENKKGIALNAPHRNYRDRNHKPELMVALSDFWLLHGFKNSEQLQQKISATPELHFLSDIFQQNGYRGLYEKVMQMDQDEVNRRLDPLIERIVPLYQTEKLEKEEEDFWAASAALHFCKDGKQDRGIFSIYFFNLLHLKKGEGVFQPAGMPHAYLEGQNVELMANSDNVLRAGLTDKHIDVQELMKHVKFEATEPHILKGGSDRKHVVFATSAEEFELHQYSLQQGEKGSVSAHTAEIVLVVEGLIRLSTGREVKMGEALLLSAGTELKWESLTVSNVFRATVPAEPN